MNARKDYETRKNEILSVAEHLFIEKGYDETSVNDILQAAAIGKGTFYYYFESKEEVMNAVVNRFVTIFAENAEKIAEDSTLTALEKFSAILLGQAGSIDNEEWVLSELHKVENAKLHQKSLTETILAICPYLTAVVKQGIEEGTFHTPYPAETIEILLIANQFMFDAGIFQWSQAEFLKKVEAFIYSMELLLGTKKGSFQFIIDIYREQLEEGKNEE